MIRSAFAGAAVAVLAGCASLNSLDAQVSTFSRWPEGRAPATYAFERLPSQAADPQASQMLEDSARGAVEGAGFVPAAEGAVADVSVQIGARITATERSPFDDPYWYGAWGPYYRGWGYGRWGRLYAGPHLGPYPYGRYGAWGYSDLPYYQREVAVLIRDKKSGEPLYESRASSDGNSSATLTVLPAMFSAALQDFPRGGSANPHRVRIELAAAR
jgi:hypothetical protein